jgi:hypothetical protein
MSAALQTAGNIVKLPAAKPFLLAIKCMHTLTRSCVHESGLAFAEEATTLKVELAAFPLRSQVAKQKFVADAEATTPVCRETNPVIIVH